MSVTQTAIRAISLLADICERAFFGFVNVSNGSSRDARDAVLMQRCDSWSAKHMRLYR